MIGKKFGLITVLSEEGKDKHGNAMIKGACRCGKEIVTRANSLRSGHTKSCGCFNFKNNRVKHGMWKTNRKMFDIWNDMIQRCMNPKDSAYHNYGGRGIEICERWLKSPVNFLEDMGECPAGMTLDRIDVNGNYCPENCKWSSWQEQQINKRPRSPQWGQLIEIDGEFKSMHQWAQEYSLPISVIKARLKGAKKTTKKILEPKKIQWL